MALLTESLSVRALFEFRENLELGDGMFQAITGVEAKDLMAFRRGRLKEKPVITPQASERIEQCKKAFDLAREFCGDQDRALDWFYADAPAFGGKSPIDLTLTLGGLEKIQAFIDVLRKAVAGTNGDNSRKAAEPPTSANPRPAGPDPLPEKPSLPVIAISAKTKPADIEITPKNLLAIPAVPAKSASVALGGVAARTTSYVPGGMARSRAQALVRPEISSVETTSEKSSATLTPTASIGAQANPSPTSDATHKPEPVAADSPPQSVTAPPEAVPPPPNPSPSRALATPPTGVATEKRIFLLKEPFTRLREKKPDLTLKEISAAMLERGCSRFAVQTHASRLVKSYTWATWTEVANLAEILDADPYDLGSVRSE